MKFELFNRFKDNEDNDEMDTQSQGYGGNEFSDGGNLSRTIENLFDQGYSQEEIVQELSGRYSQNEIQNAINKTVKSGATSKNSENELGGDLDGAPEPMSKYQADEEPKTMEPMDEGFSNSQNNNNSNNQNNMNSNQGKPQSQNNLMDKNQNQTSMQDRQPAGKQGYQDNQNQPTGQQVDSSIEELVEMVISENFKQVENEFENVYDEIDKIVEEVSDMKQRLHDLEVRKEEQETQVVDKMDELKTDIDNYESRIGGLEKAFQQVLPSLVDNVRELTDLVQEMKQEKGIETDASVSEDEIEGMEDW